MSRVPSASPPSLSSTDAAVQPVAVVDVGTTSIRMAVAEVRDTGEGESFTTKWDEAGEKSVTASCGESSAETDVTVVAVDKVIIDGSDPEDDGPATICVEKSITLRAVPKPAGANFPDGSPKWEITEKPDGSEIGNPADGSATAEISPDKPGTYKIKASCGTSSQTFTLNAVKVTIDPDDLIRTGYTRYGNQNSWCGRQFPEVSKTVTFTVEPKEMVTEVEPDVQGKARVEIKDKTVDENAGTIKFKVTGIKDQENTTSEPDTWIRAMLGESVCAEVPVIVVVPKAIQTPHPEVPDGEGSEVTGENKGLNPCTSPAFIDPRINNDSKVALVTIYGHDLQITIVDQFGDPLDELYEGAEVSEKTKASGGFFYINQQLDANGTYTDPVGFIPPKRPLVVNANSTEHDQWENQDPPAPFGVDKDNQNIQLRVGGHPIPNIRRKVTAKTNPDRVIIEWP
jgi:hypothetical protein